MPDHEPSPPSAPQPCPPRSPAPPRSPFKGATGWRRLWRACGYSRAGFAAAWRDEAAFRQVCVAAAIGLPLALALGRSWAERILLLLPLALAIMVELCNSAIENAVDCASPDWHPLAKKAKDMGSAAQFAAQALIALVWLSCLWERFF